MVAKEQVHRVLGRGTVRILGLGVVGASAKNRGEMPLVQALTMSERVLWRDEVKSGRPLGWSAVEGEPDRKMEFIHSLGFEPAGLANGWSVQPGREE